MDIAGVKISMNAQELNRQIAKFKARRTKTRLSYYGSVASLFLLFSTLGGGISITSLVSFLMLVPLPAYFIIQSIKLSKKNYRLKEHSALILNSADSISSKFSIGKFITQPNLTFRLTLILILLAFFTTLARTRAEEPSLSMNHSSLTVSR